jgi:hypothetical protein
MMPRSQARNRRDTPYTLDRMFVTLHRSAAGTLWRFRTELASLTAATGGIWELARMVPLFWTVALISVVSAVVMAVPWTRRQVTGRMWCVLSRHRLQRVCWETRMHTRSGRLPLVLRIFPTEVGERAVIWCRAGICKDDFELNAAEIAAACYARQARIEGHRRWAQIVVLDVVRRDKLAPHTIVTSGLPARPPRGRADS